MKPRYAANTSKLALVLAGGGMTGAVYEIGALRAIDDLLVDRSVTDFDIFVGTSAGAIIATFLANGFSPETMFQVIAGQHPDIPSIQRKYIFNFNQREVLPARPGAAREAVGHYLRVFARLAEFHTGRCTLDIDRRAAIGFLRRDGAR